MSETGLAAARSVALYLLSLLAVASALLAWPPPAGATAALVVVTSMGLAIATVLGESLSPLVDSLLERRARVRLRASVAAIYVGLVVVSLSAAVGAGEASVVADEVAVFALAQGVFLAFLDVLGGPLLALANALVLVVLASLAGGPPAAVAATGYLPLLVFFLTFDHFLRRLAAYPATRASLLGAALGQAAVAAVPLTLLMSLFLQVAPPRPYARLARDERRASASPAVREAYGRLLLLGLAGGALVLIARRLLRPLPGGSERTEEILEAERGSEEALPETPAAKQAIPVSGERGRIVRAYLRFLEQAERRVFRRRPSHTPVDIATHVREPVEPLARLTELFADARYGPDEPGLEEARAAETAADRVVAHLKRRARIS